MKNEYCIIEGLVSIINFYTPLQSLSKKQIRVGKTHVDAIRWNIIININFTLIILVLIRDIKFPNDNRFRLKTGVLETDRHDKSQFPNGK